MSIPMNSHCIQCHLNKNLETARELGDSETATAFAHELLMVHYNAPKDASSPYLGPPTNALLEKYYGLTLERFRKEKEDSNQFILERMDQLTRIVEQQTDPVLAALRFSILGNYLDFHALHGPVSFEKLDQMLLEALDMPLDMAVYDQLRKDMAQGKTLLYITDNAGEIGFDRILAQQIHKEYPQLRITFLVRGQIAQNDATREDAEVIGLEFPVIDNGNDVAGTEFSLLSPEAKEAIETSDVIIAKGMGNTESMFGCGYNVYYALLVKCIRFMEFFQKPMMTPLLVKDHK